MIGFSFGALLEGAAGFGAPVRLPVLYWWAWASNRYTRRGWSDCQHCAGGVWCVGCANSGPGQVTGIDPFDIGAMAGRQLRSCRFLCRSGW